MEFIIKEFDTKLSPVSIYSLFKDEKNTIFLDSGRNESGEGRFSIIGLNPFFTYKSRGEEDSFKIIKEELSKYKIINNTELPFLAGAIGYFGYDLGRTIEKIPKIAEDDNKLPWCYFNFYDNVIIYDNLENKTYITALGILSDKDKSIDEIINKIKNFNTEIDNLFKSINEIKKEVEYSSNFQKEEYIETVDKVKNYIKDGDIYITNLTQRLMVKTEKDPFEVYSKLRSINPAPFAAYLNLDGFKVVSSSPERFLKIKDGIVETSPIKGTRPRGKTLEEDNILKNELINSEKDKSELLMIVDLERNDLSKVCKENTVKVRSLFKLEEYSTVFHLVSTIKGELKDDISSIDCIKECFPGGSITGAPKIRSMEIIDEIEKVRRGIYTGAIGYLGFEGNVDLNIVIRTIVMKDNYAYMGVGGGITYESDCKFEYQETLEKAKALLEALA